MLVTGVLADESGRFVVDGLPEGAYSVEASYTNYQSQTASLTVHGLNDIYDLGQLALSSLYCASVRLWFESQRIYVKVSHFCFHS